MLEITDDFRTRRWVFDIFHNDKLKIDIDELSTKIKTKCAKGVQWAIVGKEVGSQGGRHLQGAIWFKNAKSRTQLQKWTKGGKHYCDAMRGTAEENNKYCSKDRDFWEIGEPPQQGKRNDIAIVKEQLKEGANMKKIINIATSNQSIQFTKTWLSYNERKRDWKPEVHWYWGDTGTGKSKKAHLENRDAYWATSSAKWWDGYDGHEVVIIDDLREHFCSFNEMLKILDRFPYRIEYKGGYRQLLAKKIIITSCLKPEEVWSEDENMEQLKRRIDVIEHFKKNTEV